MTKTAIYTVMIGDNPAYPLVTKNFEYYAKKINADLIICSNPNHSKPYLNQSDACIIYCLEKLEIGHLLEVYDRVLYLDSDILIHLDAPNIFDTYPDTNSLYAFNESSVQDRSSAIAELKEAIQTNITWNNTNKRDDYYNAGVMLFSKEQKNFFDHIDMEEMQKMVSVDMFEQTYFNYLFQKHHIPIQSLNYKFNRMEMMGGHFRRMRSYFMHYAGSGFTGRHNKRYQLLIDDLLTFYAAPLDLPKTKPNWIYQLRKFLYKIHWFISIPPINYY